RVGGHQHLRFTREAPANPRRRRVNGLRPRVLENPARHAEVLQEQLDEAVREKQPAEPGFDPRLLLSLEVENLQPQQLEAIPGLEVVSQESKKVLVLFASEEGAKEFSRRLSLLRQGQRPSRQEVLFAIDRVDSLTRDDRTGPALKHRGLPDGQECVLDVELWPVPQSEIIDSFRKWADGASIQVLDRLSQPGLILFRLRCPAASVDRLLDHRDV